MAGAAGAANNASLLRRQQAWPKANLERSLQGRPHQERVNRRTQRADRAIFEGRMSIKFVQNDD